MRVPWLLVASAALLFLVIYLVDFSVWQTGWIGEISVGLGTNLVAALVIFRLIDRVVERNLERERMRRRAMAMRQLCYPLSQYANTWLTAYKAASAETPPFNPNVRSMFDTSDFILQLRYLNASASAGVEPPATWLVYLTAQVDRFRQSLQSALDTHSTNFRVEDAELISALQRTSMMEVLGEGLKAMANMPERIPALNLFFVDSVAQELARISQGCAMSWTW